jgi:hypothetical protein
VAEKSTNLKDSLVLAGMFRFMPTSQFVERYHSVELNMEDFITNNFCKFSKQ